MYENENYNPTEKDIFKKDSEGNSIYFDFLGRGYIINNIEKKNYILTIEGYRYFICSYKPPIIIPIIIFSMIIAIGLFFIAKVEIEIKAMTVYLSFIFYVITCFIYQNIILRALVNSTKITRQEKKKLKGNT